jgi:hypothetical protein
VVRQGLQFARQQGLDDLLQPRGEILQLLQLRPEPARGGDFRLRKKRPNDAVVADQVQGGFQTALHTGQRGTGGVRRVCVAARQRLMKAAHICEQITGLRSQRRAGLQNVRGHQVPQACRERDFHQDGAGDHEVGRVSVCLVYGFCVRVGGLGSQVFVESTHLLS